MKANLFCAGLCFSYSMFVMTFMHQNTESFLEGQQKIFEYFCGVPHKVNFDNAKVVVKVGFGKHAVMRNAYKTFDVHRAFSALFCNIASENGKGLLENFIGFSKRNLIVQAQHLVNLSKINVHLSNVYNDYKSHTILGRESSVGVRPHREKS